ncbi:cupin domain-containing protein [Methylocella silvestris]|uniref:Cupin n=1 Tax=Methylocella silvestris TaxID=199596 RepID=A0A2J7TH37_METSI|nr:cupin domain-containing protein [Methylocella silvestris]PNG26067.1 cupin [Methylocella silvestris]
MSRSFKPVLEKTQKTSVNVNFLKRLIIFPDAATWTPSPQKGVERLTLDLFGDERVKTTYFARFAPGSALPRHVHDGGEEIFVMEGGFQDENGSHGAGEYLRDPRGSTHTPTSAEGCLLFVKLGCFAPGDEERVKIDSASGEWRKAPEGFAIQPLHHFAGVTTFLVRLDPGAILTRMIHPHGEEAVVLAGACKDDEGSYAKGSWIRDPGGHPQSLISPGGCTLFVKTGHIAAAAAEAAQPVAG